MPQSRRNALRALYEAGDRSGLNGECREPVGLRDLRHSFVAVALASGLTLPEASVLARHANPRITAMAYAGLRDDARAKLGRSSRPPSGHDERGNNGNARRSLGFAVAFARRLDSAQPCAWANGGERVRTAAPNLQAGGRWFELAPPTVPLATMCKPAFLHKRGVRGRRGNAA
jgi:hypothetical protein